MSKRVKFNLSKNEVHFMDKPFPDKPKKGRAKPALKAKTDDLYHDISIRRGKRQQLQNKGLDLIEDIDNAIAEKERKSLMTKHKKARSKLSETTSRGRKLVADIDRAVKAQEIQSMINSRPRRKNTRGQELISDIDKVLLKRLNTKIDDRLVELRQLQSEAASKARKAKFDNKLATLRQLQAEARMKSARKQRVKGHLLTSDPYTMMDMDEVPKSGYDGNLLMAPAETITGYDTEYPALPGGQHDIELTQSDLDSLQKLILLSMVHSAPDGKPTRAQKKQHGKMMDQMQQLMLMLQLHDAPDVKPPRKQRRKKGNN